MTTDIRTELDLKQSILKVLERHVGRNNPIKASTLATMFGYSTKNTWAIRQPIGELIKDGYPILSALTPPEGYFMASSFAEVNEHCESLKHRGIEVIIRRRDVKLAAQRYFTGQSKLL